MTAASPRHLRYVPLVAALAAGLVLAPCARAADLAWYLSGAAGRATAGVNTAEFDGALSANGIPATAQVSGADAGWTLSGGLQFQRHWAIEGGYADLGRAHTQVDTVGITNPAALLQAIADDGPVLPHGWTVQVVGRVFPTRRLHAFVRIGLLRWASNVHVDAPPIGTLNRHLSGVALAYGAGLEYRLFGPISARLALQRYELRGGAVDFTSLGLRYDFRGLKGIRGTNRPVGSP